MASGLHVVLTIAIIASSVGCATSKGSKSGQLVSQGNELAKDGLLREAAISYRKALRLKSNNPSARRNLGIVQIKLKEYKAAVNNLEKVISKFEGDFESNYWLAEGYRSIDRNADAIYRYKKALEIRSDDMRAKKALAWTYYRVRYYSETLALAKSIVVKYPADLQAVLILARTLIKINNSKEALALIEKSRVHANEMNLPYLQSVEGDAYYAENRCTDAIKVYREALKTQPLLPGPLLGLGQCQLAIGKFTEGIGYLERAVKIKPEFTEAVYTLAKAYEQQKDRRSTGMYKKFRKLAAKDPEFLERLAEINQKLDDMRGKKTALDEAKKPLN
jgi:tetratricopeptide (TPR) repeat protein